MDFSNFDIHYNGGKNITSDVQEEITVVTGIHWITLLLSVIMLNSLLASGSPPSLNYSGLDPLLPEVAPQLNPFTAAKTSFKEGGPNSSV